MQRQLELLAVLLSAVVFLVLPKPPAAVAPIAAFIVLCMGGWSTYLVAQVRRDPTLLERWGLRPTTNLGPLLRVLGPLAALAVALGVGVAIARGKPLVAEWMWLSLLLYPLWGLVQQWLVQALVVDNVRALTGLGLPGLMALGAVGFGVIHLEHPLLMVATAGLGGVYVALFQRWRNLWPLAACHGWLGSLFYPWVLDLNPIGELMGLLG